MNRRQFTQAIPYASVLPWAPAGLDFKQQAPFQITYPDRALAAAQVLGIFAGDTPTDPSRAAITALGDSALSVMERNFNAAEASLGRFTSVFPDASPSLAAAASGREIPYARDFLTGIVPMLETDLGRVLSTENPVVTSFSWEQVACIARCGRVAVSCGGPAATKVLACLWVSKKFLPRWQMALAAFTACVIEDIPELAADLIVNCVPEVARCVQDCFPG